MVLAGEEVSPRIASHQLDVELLEDHVLHGGEALPQPVVVDDVGIGDVVLVHVAGEETAHAEHERMAFAAVGDVGEPAVAGPGVGRRRFRQSLFASMVTTRSLRGVEAELDVRLEHELHRAADPL